MSKYMHVSTMADVPTCPHCKLPVGDDARPLTWRQTEIYAYLRQYIAEHDYAPSFMEIAAYFEYAALATVHEHLTNLERKGWIKRIYNESRSIRCLVDVA